MADHCINGTIEGVNYSSPVPVIGLYIAGASILCALLMLYDIGCGFWDIKELISCRSFKLISLTTKRWLPCKSFQLNSLTLTLLGIATKLPVDLTTDMPSQKDQLSKLTGTAFICISMAFLVPSLGVSSESECSTNLWALTIFVFTVAVNICIQLQTGVIVFFFKEHIAVLVLMFLLLLMLWYISSITKAQKRITSDRYNTLFAKGSSSMLDRLKLCYLYAYCSDPQFNISIHPINAAIGTVCLTCLGIVLEATFRSIILKQLKFCEGDSDYKWSMILIVSAQIITVIVGTFAVVFRWLSLFSRMDFEKIIYAFLEDDEVKQMNQTLGKGSKRLKVQNFFATQILRLVLLVQLLIVFPSVLVSYFLCVYQQDNLERFDDLPHEGIIAASAYIVRKGVDEILRLKEVFHRESLYQVLQLLSRRSPSERVINNSSNTNPMENKNSSNTVPMEIRKSSNRKDIKVCSLSIALLIKIAQASIPGVGLLKSLVHVFNEAKEIIQYIDETMQPKSSDNNDKFSYAKALWIGGDFRCLLPKNFNGDPTPVQVESELDPDLARAVNKIKKLEETFCSGIRYSQVGDIIDFLDLESCKSVDNLCTSIERLFVDMLHALLIQLPNAISKSLSESPAEEFEERVRNAMEFLIKIGCLEEVIGSIPPPPNFPYIISGPETPVRVFKNKELEKLGNVVPVPRPRSGNENTFDVV